MQRILDALPLMPRHREDSRRSSSIGLDELLDDLRSVKDLDSGTLDLVLMGYRFRARALKEIEAFLKGKRLKPLALEDLLVLCFGSLLTRNKTPYALQVNNFVEASARRFGVHTKVLVNAFARGLLRKLDSLLKEFEKNRVSWLPDSLQKRWAAYPSHLQNLSQRCFERPESGFYAFFVDVDKDATLKHERRTLEEWKKLEAEGGTFQAMDLGSWLLLSWMQREMSGRDAKFILDACAAPGGKCIALSMLYPKAKILATESKFPRLQRLKSNLERWGCKNVQTQIFEWGVDNQAEVPNPWNQNLDLILADLPCSGSGTLHTRPDLLSEDLESRVNSLLPVQQKILEELLSLKAKDLFVSLCSVDPIEIENISKILKTEPSFASWQIPDAGLAEGLSGWHIKTL
jgi:16S rRNA C967 or C1407 C5-methylase (RsmB/RsmF family)